MTGQLTILDELETWEEWFATLPRTPFAPAGESRGAKPGLLNPASSQTPYPPAPIGGTFFRGEKRVSAMQGAKRRRELTMPYPRELDDVEPYSYDLTKVAPDRVEPSKSTTKSEGMGGLTGTAQGHAGPTRRAKGITPKSGDPKIRQSKEIT